MEFNELPANKMSIAKRKLLCGVGINDADYVTTQTINGKRLICPFYRRWTKILERCFDKKFQAKQPAYKTCTVSDEWLLFSNFKRWMKNQEWEGKHLDKDILTPGNKVYSAKACLFVSSQINHLLLNCKARRGVYPQGVNYNKKQNNFQAFCSVKGRKKYLGAFATPEEANQVYKQFKSKHIIEIANKQIDIRIKKGLLLHAKLLSN